MRLLSILSILTLSFALTGCDFLTRPSLAEKVILDVNGRQLTAQDFSKELAYRLRDQDSLSAKDPKLVTAIKAKIVEDFIVKTLTESWARENGIVVKAEELEAQTQAVQKTYPDDLGLQQALLNEGISFKDWRERMQDTLLQKAVAIKVTEAAEAPTDSEGQTYFQEHKAEFQVRETAQVRQILVATESDARAIETELKKGKRMSDLAPKYSLSPEASQGGMVGWVEKGLTDIFEPAFHMKQGQRSPVLKSAFGYHIFEVLTRKPSRNKSFQEAKAEIKGILMEKRQQSLYLAWLEEQVRKSRVFKDQTFIDALKVETK